MPLSNSPEPAPYIEEFATEVSKGLNNRQKSLPCRFLYDARGSELFEDITDLEEYYPTRTEIALLQQHAYEIADIAGPNASLIEFGSGSSKKTRYLIKAIQDIHSYVPIDISDSALEDARRTLKTHFPDLSVSPVHADFTQLASLTDSLPETVRLGFFPGSTIGNFEKEEAVTFLVNARKMLDDRGAMLIGVDLQKDLDILIPAYDDANGVTAAFNLNILERINRELGADFDLEAFRHLATYNTEKDRIEMHLESLKDQHVDIQGKTFEFSKGETIHTENSHKYTIESFHKLADQAGWDLHKHWTDDANLFSIHYLTPK